MNYDVTIKFENSLSEERKRTFIKLYAGQLITSGTAVQMLGISKELFLSEVNRYQVAVSCLDTDEVVSKMQRENDKTISKVREIVSRAKMVNQGRTPHFWGRPDMINMIQQIIEAV